MVQISPSLGQCVLLLAVFLVHSLVVASLDDEDSHRARLLERLEKATRGGGAYVGSGYDCLLGNPDALSVSGSNSGPRPADFILEKTFTRPDDSLCPVEATCTGLAGNSEIIQLQLDMINYQETIEDSLTLGAGGGVDLEDVYVNLEGSMSSGYQSAQQTLEKEQKVLIDVEYTEAYYDVSFSYLTRGFLTEEFLSHVCRESQPPHNYSQADYLSIIQRWGTHVIVHAILGSRRTERFTYSGKDVACFLFDSQSNLVSLRGDFLTLATIDARLNSTRSVASSIQQSVKSIDWKNTTSGTRDHPIPLSMKFKPLDYFLTKEFIKAATVEGLNRHNCSHLLNNATLAIVRKHLQRALEEYPTILGAKPPSPIVRNTTRVCGNGGTSSGMQLTAKLLLMVSLFFVV
ncbi:hypothetical protein BV898_03043 [Hypsibius exemplaris]|uniref:MACPF domain-containing protein n=1 Tax=Hypsibius exemplaris TaxID=2072580 RepID=A0A1W0X6P5_HYPEX|nr:hypothetical protein BV898_03043 [Hypsibius exemplaris]